MLDFKVELQGSRYKVSCGGLWEVGDTHYEAMGKLVISLAAAKKLTLDIAPDVSIRMMDQVTSAIRRRLSQ